MADTQQEADEAPRQIGRLRPESDHAARALRALQEHRLRDAVTHVAAIPDTPTLEHAWKLFLSGLAALERGDLAATEPVFLRSICLALMEGLRDGEPVRRDAMRLAAWGLEKIGWINRRLDRPDDAFRAHLAAYRLRHDHGSFVEMWESATSLGLDADVATRHAVGQSWHRKAIEIAARVAEEPIHKQALCWTHLAHSLTESEHHDEAVEAAARARACFRRHDIGAVATARADMKLGHALLKLGASLHAADRVRAQDVLGRAVNCLETAHESLLAFGPDGATDAYGCLEQRDFALRLRASIGL